jgi:hypothetical protein
MTWPGSPTFVTTSVDNGTDSPATARGEIYKAMQDLANVIAGRGQADGVASLDADAKVPIAQLRKGIHVVTTPGSTSWTIPTGVTSLWAIAVGGGGGGGFTSAGTGGDHGGGGGGGGTSIKLYTGLTPGNSIDIVHGAAGIGGAVGVGDADGTSGGSSTVDDGTTVISGGGGGGGVGGGTRFGGGGGAASGGDINIQGGAGVSGGARGGAGGASSLAAAIAGGTPPFGGGGFGSGDATAGFDGGTGGVILIW